MESSLCKCVYFVFHSVFCDLSRVVQLLFVSMDTKTIGLWDPMLKSALDHRGVLEMSGIRL